ncbi:MAG TPA: helix-hairpin-helix domain-containing protein [Gemmatirosa sp.]
MRSSEAGRASGRVDGRAAPAPSQRRAREPLARDACARLEDLVNVGPSIAADLRRVGVAHPRDLVGRDPLALYDALCAATGVHHDPCVLDVFLSAVRFMEGATPHPWWHYTPERKRLLGERGSVGVETPPLG